MKHDSNAVHAFIERVLCVLIVKNTSLKICIYFSEGAGYQYKNYKHILTSAFIIKILSLQQYGKSPCDGIGGTVKCLVGNASLKSLQEPIDTPLRMFGLCKKNINAINI